MSDIKKVLFVCTGNSCRSVMAEALLKKYLKGAGKDGIEVRSAGTRALTGLPPTEETLEVLKAEGITLSDFKSTNLTDQMIKDADLILAMEDLHKDEILRRMPAVLSKIHLLKEYGHTGEKYHDEGIGVPDPIGRSKEFYDYVMNLIKKEVERIVKIL
ncbi:MAG: low molecular weight protein arginine phosphatase [Candidatus Omnitrophota bacterium]|jgi:protein-tyrosine-phosphatase